MAYGLGSPQVSQAAYGELVTPMMSRLRGQSIAQRAGLGRIEDENRARQAKEAFQGLVQQYGDDPVRLMNEAAKVGAISPEAYQRGMAQQQQHAATLGQRQAEQEATAGFRQDTLAQTGAWQKAQQQRWGEDRAEKGVGRVSTALRYGEERAERERHNKAMEENAKITADAAKARAGKANQSDERQNLNTAVTTTLKTYKGFTPEGFNDWPVEQRLVYLMQDSGAMAGLQQAASNGDPQAIADLGYIRNAVVRLQQMSGAPAGVPPPARPPPAPQGADAGPQMPRLVYDVNTGNFTPR